MLSINQLSYSEFYWFFKIFLWAKKDSGPVNVKIYNFSLLSKLYCYFNVLSTVFKLMTYFIFLSGRLFILTAIWIPFYILSIRINVLVDLWMSGRFSRGLLCSPDRKAAVIQRTDTATSLWPRFKTKMAFAILSPEYFWRTPKLLCVGFDGLFRLE